jgi:hypothetical protein
MSEKISTSDAPVEARRRSGGPKTPEGKARSAKNGITHGKRAAKYAEFVPRSTTILENEDRQAYFRILEVLAAQLGAHDPWGMRLAVRIADAEWRLDRWELIESLLLESECKNLPDSLPERFQFLTGAEEILLAARNLQSSAPDARLFEEIRHQQMHFHRIADMLTNRLMRIQKHSDGRKLAATRPTGEVLASTFLHRPDDCRTTSELQPDPSRTAGGQQPDCSRTDRESQEKVA